MKPLSCPCCSLTIKSAGHSHGRCPRCRSVLSFGPTSHSRWPIAIMALPLVVLAVLISLVPRRGAEAPAVAKSVNAPEITITQPPLKPVMIREAAPLPRVAAREAAPMPRELVPVDREALVAPQIALVNAVNSQDIPKYAIRYELPQRLDYQSSAELETALANARVLSLNTPSYPNESKAVAAYTRGKPAMQHVGPMVVMNNRHELAGLPFRMGDVMRLTEEQAKEMDANSKEIRTAYQKSAKADGKNPSPRSLYDSLKSQNPAASACVRQMLQCDTPDIRRMSCELLATSPGAAATEALVQWAVFDTCPENRAAAVESLKSRDRTLVSHLLAKQLRYPWLPAVEHTCEAIVALKAEEAVPALLAARNLPDPEAPFDVDLPGNAGGLFRREVVRINHARNCVLCHQSTDVSNQPLAVSVPSESQPLPPSNSNAYYSASGERVLASVTYLKQDFSLMQPVKNPGPWPIMQRFDYFVTVRREISANPPMRSVNAARYRTAYEFALESLGVALPPVEKAKSDADAAAATRFISLCLKPEALPTMKNGPSMMEMLPLQLELTVSEHFRRFGIRGARMALAAYFAEEADSSLNQEKTVRMLAAVRGPTPDGLLPKMLADLVR